MILSETFSSGLMYYKIVGQSEGRATEKRQATEKRELLDTHPPGDSLGVR